MDVIYKGFRILFPEPSEKIPVTNLTWPMLFVPFFPILYMSYLKTKPNSRGSLLFLFPIMVGLSLHAGFGYTFTDAELQALNYSMCM